MDPNRTEGRADVEQGDVGGLDQCMDVSSEARSNAPLRRGKPVCWYGSACRKIHDPAHCDKYDHETRPCKFGAKCRRQGRGCPFEHPTRGSQKPLLNTAKAGSNRHDRHHRNGCNDRNACNEANGNSPMAGERDPERPVPFVFVIISACAIALVGLPIFGGCNSSMHKHMFHFGCALGVPFLLFELLLLTCRSWVLQRFLEGDYSERATYRKLGCLWYPERVQLLRYTTGDIAGNNIEQYATWETNDLQEQVETALGGNRDGGQVTHGPGNFSMDFPGEFDGSDVTVDGKGVLRGLGIDAAFDGSTIVSGDGAWAKAGYWRLDRVTKLLLLLFVLGLESSFVAVFMPPGISGYGGLGEVHQRMPLNAVFVVDGSASIEPDMWKAQEMAGEKFIDAFQNTYGHDQGELNIGIVQFSADARTEQPLTSDIPTVLSQFRQMQQMEATTYFDKGLAMCKTNLDRFDPNRESFDVCVLITDGIDMSEKDPSALQALLPRDTAVFGIFVGDDNQGIRLLKDITECGKAKSQKHGKCNFFASASDYAALSSKADEVAGEVVRGVDLAMCAMVSALIGVPTAVAMCLPYILWMASFTGLTMWRRRTDSNNYRSLKGNNGNFSNTN